MRATDEARLLAVQDAFSKIDDGSAAAPVRLRAKRPLLAGLIVGAVAFAALFALVLHLGDLEDFARLAARADPTWILVALAAQIFAFATQAFVWGLVLARRNSVIPKRSLFLLAVGKLFADQAIPSAGVSGAVFFIHALTRRGVAAGDAFTAFVFGATSFILAFALFAAGAVGWLFFAGGPINELSINVTDIHYFAIASILLLFVIAVMFLASQSRGPVRSERLKNARETATRAIKLIYVDRGLFALCLGLQAFARLLDAVTLWIAFQALGGGVPFLTATIAVSLASLAATIAPTPMGLGSFEAGLLSSLAALGIGVETAFAGGVIYRGLTLFLPLAIGFFIVQRELLKK